MRQKNRKQNRHKATHALFPITRHSVNKLGFKIEYENRSWGGGGGDKKRGFLWNKKSLISSVYFDLFSVAAAQDISRVCHVGGARVGCFMSVVCTAFGFLSLPERRKAVSVINMH